MGTAREDYGHFVRWLHQPDRHATEDVRKFASMVLANFDSVAATSLQHNNRSLHLANLARQNLAAIAPDLLDAPHDNAVTEWPWRRLHPRVTTNEMSRSYVGRARAAKDALEDREALTYSRRALEMLSNKVWKWLAFLDRGTLAIEIERPGGEPTLRNLCDAIRLNLERDATFVHPNKDSILNALRRVLGIPAQNLIWIYLNKGTHEEENREDFDAAHVESVVSTPEQLDALDLRRPR